MAKWTDINPNSPRLSASQLNYLAHHSIGFGGSGVPSGLGDLDGVHARRWSGRARTAYWRIESNEGLGEYTVVRGQWDLAASPAAFVDADADIYRAWEVRKYKYIPLNLYMLGMLHTVVDGSEVVLLEAPDDRWPIGTIIAHGGASENWVPPGWVLCDGRELSKTTYALLFEAIETLAGGAGLWDKVGVTAGYFNAPDLGGLSLRGFLLSDSEYDPVGALGGLKRLDLTHQHDPTATWRCVAEASTLKVWDWNADSGLPDVTGTIWTGGTDGSAVVPGVLHSPNASHEIDNRGPWACVSFYIYTGILSLTQPVMP